MIHEVLDVRGGFRRHPPEMRSFSQLPLAHQQAIVRVALESGLNPSFFAAVMAHESGFNPQQTNGIGCVGLIQWCASGRNALKVTKAQILNMSFLEQVELAGASFRRVLRNKPIESLVDHAIAMFVPAAVGAPLDKPIFVKPAAGCENVNVGELPFEERGYCRNAGMDHNGDGVITPRDVRDKFQERLIDPAEKRPRVLVDMSVPAAEPLSLLELASAGLSAAVLAYTLTGPRQKPSVFRSVALGASVGELAYLFFGR